MFAKESEMTRPASDWLKANGMQVKAEFVVPWGICDLVGLRFDAEKVTCRMRLGQRRPLASIARAALLLQIPDAETGESTTLDRLARQAATSLSRESLSREAQRLIADRFVSRSEDGRLQKLNAWMPLHERLVAIELKRSKVEEAMNQALGNMGFAEESYVGLPMDLAQRIGSKPARWARFFDEGVGLLGVDRKDCRVIVPPRENRSWADKAIQMYCVDKFWDRTAKRN